MANSDVPTPPTRESDARRPGGLLDQSTNRSGFDHLTFDERGLIPAVVQQHDTGEVLMVAWMNAESLRLTLERGETVFWSRSRRELWHKGATSGNTQRVVELRYDCDGDTLLALVDAGAGPACHTGERTCFHRALTGPEAPAGAAPTGRAGPT